MVEYILTALTIINGVLVVATFVGNRKKDNVSSGKQGGLVESRLISIDDKLLDLKSDTKDIKGTLTDHGDRLTRVEESCKQAHKRIDSIERRKDNDIC